MMNNNFMSMYQAFRQNPVGFMMQSGMNVPQNMMGNPDAIIQQMMNSGQISQQTYNQAQQIAQQMLRQQP